MKTMTFIKRILPIALIVVWSCDPCHPVRLRCRLDKFYWEGKWHQANYAGDRLVSLIGAHSEIYFAYNAARQLEKAEIYTGDPTPKYKFTFTHGPFGITETDLRSYYGSSEERVKYIYHYASPTRIDYIIYQEFGAGPGDPPTFELQENFTYTGNNVTFVDGLSDVIHTQYSSNSYDKKQNPFRLLGKEVGNPLFFPACRLVPFPVAEYDISILSIFSQNNPLKAQYEIPGSGIDPQEQTFTNTYTSSLATKIHWEDASLGTAEAEDYAFELACGHTTSEED
jgi:hypothetical protein